jgi:hypothetical protein
MGNVFLFMFWCAIYILGGSWFYSLCIELAHEVHDENIMQTFHDEKGWVILLWPVLFIYAGYVYFTSKDQ